MPILDKVLQGTTAPPRKGILDRVLDNTAPLRQEDTTLAERGQGFRGDSDYDQYLAIGSDQNQIRAQNQPWTHELANAVVKTAPGVALGIVENFGSLAELFSGDQDYDNMFTQVARNSRDWIENKLPTYREDPNEVFDLGDSAWWISHGQGLVESVGEFLVTGAGVGGALSKSAKLLNKAMKGGELASKIGQGAAQLGTASSLAYTEGAMSGARVYKDVLEASSGDVALASKAASETVRLNTILNTGLNLTGLSPLFKNFNRLDDGIKAGINRKPKESIVEWIKRLTLLETQGVPQASIVKKLALEAGQEGLEEDVNLFAEQEGYITGGVEEKIMSRKRSAIDRFIDNATTEEGALNFILGAVGGVAQTAGMEYAPIKDFKNPDGTKSKISARELEKRETASTQKSLISQFKQDVQSLETNLKALNAAQASGDKVALETARENLFDVTAFKSIRNETVEELATELAAIASVDNTTIRENGATDAMNQGLAENIDDNRYKQVAIRKASDVKMLNQEYRDLLAQTQNPRIATGLFNTRMNVYAHESVYNTLQEDTAKGLATVTKLVTDPNLLSLVTLRSEIEAYNGAEAYFRQKGRTEEADKIAYESKIARKLYADTIASTPYTDEQVAANGGLYAPLAQAQADSLVVKENLYNAKKKYADELANKDKVEKKLKKQEDAITAVTDKLKKDKEEADAKARRDKDFEDAKVKAEEEKRLKAEAEAFLEQTRKENEAKNEEDKQLNTNEDGKEKEEVLESSSEEANTVLGVSQLQNLTPITNIFVPLSPKARAAEYERLTEKLDKQNNLNSLTYGNHNKIAYKAQEQNKQGETVDPFVINDIYKILHSPDFNEGTTITLKPAKDSPYYKETDSVEKVAIGVYYKGQLVGYLPVFKAGMDETLLLARNFIVKAGEVTDTISRKTPGTLNTGVKDLVSNNYAFTPTFLIGRNSSYEIAIDQAFKGELMNSEVSQSGFIYTADQTPNGKTLALPVDANRVLPTTVDSMMKVLDLYFKGERDKSPSKLNEEEQALVKELQEQYGFDPSTPKGLMYYFDLFFYGTNLDDKTEEGKFNIEVIQKDLTRNNHYVQVSSRGIRFLESGGIVEDYGRNDLNDTAKTERLVKHLSNAFARVDITKINKKGEFKAPILNKQDNTYTKYTKASYNQHVASVTSTNVIAVRISDTQQTSLVQPTIHLGFEFMSKPAPKNLDFEKENGQKVVSLATKKGEITLLDDYSEEEFETQPENMDEATREEFKKKCLD